jgi:BirA family biotin operon repressor/biotin-[acetyl-CoA-carboxylase] ligase
MLSPAAAVALAETLEEFCQLPVGIKWPNDLVVEDRKVCGLLLESMPNGSIVIGVGLNLNTTDEWFEKNELPLASSISIDPADRTPLLAALASSLLGIEERVAESTELQSAFDRRDVLVGQVVHCMDGPTPHTGRVHEIDLIRGLTLDIDGDRLLLSPHTIRVLP